MSNTNTILGILYLVFAVSVVQGHIIMQCPQITNIKLNKQGHMNGAQTIHIKRQPVSINLLNQHSSYNHGQQTDPVRQQLDILKTKSFTIGGHNGMSHNQANYQNIAPMETNAERCINERSRNGQAYLDSKNQNLQNNMVQQLNIYGANAQQRINQIENQQKATQNQIQNIVINIGAYHSPGQQSQQIMSQSTSQMASVPTQPTTTQQQSSTQNSQNIQVSDAQWQAVRSAFIQNHRDRVNNIVSNSSSQTQNQNIQNQSQSGQSQSQSNQFQSQNTQSQSNQFQSQNTQSQNNQFQSQNTQRQQSTKPRTIQRQAATITRPSQSKQFLNAKIKTTIYEGPDSLSRRIDNLQAHMLALHKKHMMKKLNQHYLMAGANQDIFSNFRVPSFSGSPSYTSTHCGPMRPMSGCSCSMGWPM